LTPNERPADNASIGNNPRLVGIQPQDGSHLMKPYHRKLLNAETPIALVALILVLAPLSAPAEETALDRYIAKSDPVFAWKLLDTIPGPGHKSFVLELTSQTWRTEADVDRPVWTHWLTIIKPDTAKINKALLYVGGGRNGTDAPPAASERSIQLAVESNSVVAELGMVPNQPLYFTDNKQKGRSEDDLIAYSRIQYLKSGDEEWLVRLAMVKSAVRAMDAVQAFLATDAGGNLKIDEFVVAGGSKRGWTTWLTAAVDHRVIAIMPLVIDALNTEAITRHQYAAYGFFSPALNDYVHHKLYPDLIGTPEMARILKIEDPFAYFGRDRLKIPKYLINASGDQFFLPDNSQFYFHQMPEEKHLRYVPNTKHSLAGTDARESMLAFYTAILKNKPRPKFSWTLEKDGPITVTVQDRPRQVNLWQAANPKARDFRVDTIGKAYTSTPLSEKSPGTYVAQVPKPAKGFTAFFVELVYDSAAKVPYKFTTDVNVIPDVLPYSFEDAKKN
jgi:PhoPQ-activated pathogenicity-related protein